MFQRDWALSALCGVAMLLAGCGGIRSTDLTSVKEGATRTEVEKVLDEQIMRMPSSAGETVTYQFNRGSEDFRAPHRHFGGGFGAVAENLRYLIHISKIQIELNEAQRGYLEVIYGADGRVVSARDSTTEYKEMSRSLLK